MDESILNSIKQLIGGIDGESTQFDKDIIIHINSVFMVLNQLGVGPSAGFSIQDSSAKWSDFISDSTRLEAVKSYMYMKVRLMFDPPVSSIVTEATNRIISELEWRLSASAELQNMVE